jgi:hypothetical protein
MGRGVGKVLALTLVGKAGARPAAGTAGPMGAGAVEHEPAMRTKCGSELIPLTSRGFVSPSPPSLPSPRCAPSLLPRHGLAGH